MTGIGTMMLFASQEGSSMDWITPKTNWVASDYFNWSDYNRIKNNLAYLHEMMEQIYPPFDFNSTSDWDIYSYDYIWTPSDINRMEEDLTTLYRHSSLNDFNIGTQKTFSYNGAFITYTELNRLESAILNMYQRLINQIAGRKRLAYKLGGVQF